MLLTLFAFLAGIVTILSPCILPVTPIVLASSAGKQKPLWIIAGFVISFTFFTLFLATIVKAIGIPPDTLRWFAIIIIFLFGLSMTANIELFKTILMPKTSNGFLLGMSLGLVWAPCVGPILASVIALAATGTVTAQTFFITLAYSLGTAIPMFIILAGGRKFIPTTPQIQKIFGALMVAVAVAMFFNLDRKFETWVLTVFPNYGTGLTKIESNAFVAPQLSSMGMAPEISGEQMWFNTKPLLLSALKGKVVMIDFWTYTCINCIRTLPYTKAWYEKYKDKGFVLIGVHTPEFAFEKNADNVQKAINDFGITYPVVQDNDYAIWNAYGNRYWPADYLINQDGKIVDTHFGEGDYDATEKKIQNLLSVSMPINNPTYQIQTRTPETYLGNARGDYSRITTTGTWTKTDEYAKPSAGSSLTFDFNAAKVFLVMRGSGSVNVSLDGKFVKTVEVAENKLYQLIDLSTPGEHLLKLDFPAGGLELYAFTFG